MVQTIVESGWQGSDQYIAFLSVMWNKNLGYAEKINDSTDINLTLKSLSDFYYGLYNIRSAMIFFIETNPESDAKIKEIIAEIKTITHGAEIIRLALDWTQIQTIRDKLFDFQDELYRVAGKSKLLVGITMKKKYESVGEELDEENA